MKKIASLLAASLCTLAFLSSAAAAGNPSSWMTYDWPALDSPSSPAVEVVTVPVAPNAAKLPGILASAWPQYEEAIAAVRSAIVQDPSLKAELEAKGVAPDKVIGITYSRNGAIAVLVNQA